MTRHRLRIVLAVLCSPALLAAVGLGDLIPSTIKSSSNPAANRTVIENAIKGKVADLSGDDAVAQKAAREALINESGGATASPQYEAEYATDLINALAPLMKPENKLRVRLNAAVVLGDVAAHLHSSDAAAKFNGIVRQLLADKQPAIVLWGMKTAKYVLGNLAQGGANVGGLTQLIVQAVKNHPESGSILEEAYSALTLSPYKNTDPNIAKMAEGVLPDLLNLIEWRAAQYRAANPPPSPLAEHQVTVFLPVTAFAAVNANSKTRDRTLKVTAELTCAVLHSIANGNNNQDLIDMAREDGKAFAVFGMQLQNPALQTAGQAVSETTGSTDPNQIGTRCDNLTAALKAMDITIEQ